MPTADAHIIKRHTFSHKGETYEVVAFVEPSNLTRFTVEVTSDGQEVVITYPDGFKARLGYYVDLSIRLDMRQANGIDAVDELIRTAESDVKRLV